MYKEQKYGRDGKETLNDNEWDYNRISFNQYRGLYCIWLMDALDGIKHGMQIIRMQRTMVIRLFLLKGATRQQRERLHWCIGSWQYTASWAVFSFMVCISFRLTSFYSCTNEHLRGSMPWGSLWLIHIGNQFFIRWHIHDWPTCTGAKLNNSTSSLYSIHWSHTLRWLAALIKALPSLHVVFSAFSTTLQIGWKRRLRGYGIMETSAFGQWYSFRHRLLHIRTLNNLYACR